MSEIALIGKKIGMTREFYKSGQLVPVTVLRSKKLELFRLSKKKKEGTRLFSLDMGKLKIQN